MMETTTYTKATTHSKATSMTAAFGVDSGASAARRRFEGSVALLPIQPLSISGYVRPVTAQNFADEHNVRTWSPPV